MTPVARLHSFFWYLCLSELLEYRILDSERRVEVISIAGPSTKINGVSFDGERF